MTDDPGELEVPDFFDPANECHAHQDARQIIGVRPHRHLCREYPDHEPPHVCHSCGHAWPEAKAAA